MFIKILISLAVLFGLYILVSYVLLDGRISYTTSFCSSNIQDSKKRNLFLKNNLQMNYDTSNVELKKIIQSNDVWLEKHFDVKYFGILLYRETQSKEFYKIRFEKKDSIITIGNKVCDIVIDKDTIEKSVEFPYDQMGIRIGKTVEYNIYQYSDGETTPIGKLSIIAK